MVWRVVCFIYQGLDQDTVLFQHICVLSNLAFNVLLCLLPEFLHGGKMGKRHVSCVFQA